MLSTFKKQELAARRKVQDVLFSLGLTKGDVASAMDLDTSSVANDYKVLGGDAKYALPGMHPAQRRHLAYKVALYRYIHQPSGSRASVFDRNLSMALGSFLKMPNENWMALGMGLLAEEMFNGLEDARYIGYRKLLWAIFRERPGFTIGELVLHFFLQHLKEECAGDPQKLPERNEMPLKMARWLWRGSFHLLPPIVGERCAHDVDAALRYLPQKEQTVIRLRFGLGCLEPRTSMGDHLSLEQIGRHFDCTGENIRQIEYKALRRLRHPARSARLRPWIQGVYDLASRLINQNQHHAPASSAVPEINDPWEERMDGACLSIGASKSLAAAGIENFGQLAQKTEEQLAGRFNFRRNTIKELRELLSSKGLHFGMNQQEGEEAS